MLINRKNCRRSSGSPRDDLLDEVVGHRTLITGEVGEEAIPVGGLGHRQRGQSQARRPPAGTRVQHLDLPRGELNARPGEQRGRLRQREAHPRGAQLPQPARQTQPRQRQRRVEAAGQDELNPGRAVPHEDLEAVQGVGVDQFVHVVEDQPDRPGQPLQRNPELGEELR